MEIKIAYNSPIKCKLSDLNFFQGDLKSLSDEAQQKLSKEILETGFAFSPHVWVNPKNKKVYLVDGHQRIGVLRKLVKEGHKIEKIPVIPVMAKTMKEAKFRILQATSQYGKITQQGLANFAYEAGIEIDDLNFRFDLPDIDLSEFQSTFTADGKIVTVSSHERVVGVVNSGDENSEWVEMPGFKPGEKEFKLIMIFGSEEDRKKFCDKKKIEVTNVNCGQWTSRL